MLEEAWIGDSAELLRLAPSGSLCASSAPEVEQNETMLLLVCHLKSNQLPIGMV